MAHDSGNSGNRCASPTKGDHEWMGAVEKDMPLNLYVTSIAQVTNRGAIVGPGH